MDLISIDSQKVFNTLRKFAVGGFLFGYLVGCGTAAFIFLSLLKYHR